VSSDVACVDADRRTLFIVAKLWYVADEEIKETNPTKADSEMMLRTSIETNTSTSVSPASRLFRCVESLEFEGCGDFRITEGVLFPKFECPEVTPRDFPRHVTHNRA
jgi:hypothetical protein